MAGETNCEARNKTFDEMSPEERLAHINRTIESQRKELARMSREIARLEQHTHDAQGQAVISLTHGFYTR